jgi:Uma2 family endonuclease
LVEVLSSSTEKYDRSEKLIGYKSISSFREYLLVSQNQKLVIQYVKHNKKFWLQTEYGEGEIFKISSLGCSLSVDEIYQGIIFEGENL